MKCPACGGEATYQTFSGGREAACKDYDGCQWQGLIEAALDPDESPPRAVLLRTPEGRVALKAQMDQELARRADHVPGCNSECDGESHYLLGGDDG